MSDPQHPDPLEYRSLPVNRDVLASKRRRDRTMNIIVVSLTVAGVGYVLVWFVTSYVRAMSGL